MITLTKNGVFFENGKFTNACDADDTTVKNARKKTISYKILTSHNTSQSDEDLKIKFDAMASHDITYVGIIQTARASGLEKFPLPYVLTNCHNSLCAVGGTINEDDHMFGLSAAKKYGGIYVPAHQAVIHSFMRENFAGCGKMILGSDSHTRYGAIGTMAIGEGGPELVKQLLGRTYDIKYPQVVAINLHGTPKKGVGPQDVALALIGKVFEGGFVKNKVLEFVGEGIKNLPMEFRNGIDVMTTETTCLSSVWATDDQTQKYLEMHKRGSEFTPLAPENGAYYDAMVDIDLSKVESMIALPFHPSNVYTIHEFLENAEKLLSDVEKTAEDQLGVPKGRLDLVSKFKNGKMHVDQGVIAGCAGGTFDNIVAAADILKGKSAGNDKFTLSVYPASQPVMMKLCENGAMNTLMAAGASIRSAFCGPCFGAGDVPANNAFSIRHSTRNFPSREGSKPGDNQIACVALMDSRSIAATAANGGVLTAATDIDVEFSTPDYAFDTAPYDSRVYYGFGNPIPETELVFGPNISDWPKMESMADTVLLKVASVINDPVTTTDELIPSGETSSYRSNPEKLSSFALSRKDPAYVGRAKEVRCLERARLEGNISAELAEVYEKVAKITDTVPENIMLGSVVCAKKPGDGSAREQAASCQKVLGGLANIATEYATKRYRSNLINWGMLPFTCPTEHGLKIGDYVLLTGVREVLESGKESLVATVITENGTRELELKLENLSKTERDILLSGCLINYYRN